MFVIFILWAKYALKPKEVFGTSLKFFSNFLTSVSLTHRLVPSNLKHSYTAFYVLMTM